MTTIALQRPAANQTLTVAPQANNGLMFDFNTNEANLSRHGEDLNITFNDGAAISLTNFYNVYTAEHLPEFFVQNQEITAEQFFANISNLMPAVGSNSTATGSGTSVQNTTGTLLQGIDSLEIIDQGTTNNNTAINTPETTTTTVIVPDAQAMPISQAIPATQSIQITTSNSDTNLPADSVEQEVAPLPQIFGQADLLAADAGSRITGNLFANDSANDDLTITNFIAPEGWSAIENADGSITYTYDHDINTTLTIHANGDYILTTNVENAGIDNFYFSYEAQDQAGNSYAAQVTVGNANANNLYVETLEGGSAFVTTEEGNSYLQDFSSYADDTEIGNQHVNGMLLGSGDDTITVDNAIGSQNNPYYADANDTFIYGDALRNEDPSQVGDDVINITTLDGTKVRADGNLYDGVNGGDDLVNVERMEGGSIIGDGWNLENGSAGGNDTINIDIMQSGDINGDGVLFFGNAKGGNDEINIGTIDTTISGNQRVNINGNSGNDTICVGNIDTNSGDAVVINGGLGSDLFNYDSDADDTMALLGNQVYIAGQGQISITGFEGIGSGAGNDLVKLYDRVNNELDYNDLFVDAGEGMDVLLGNFSSADEFSTLIENDDIVNTEYVVLSDELNNASTTSTSDLFNKLEDEGVSKDANGTLSFDNTWSKNESVGDFDSYTNQENDMTILVARTQVENTLA